MPKKRSEWPSLDELVLCTVTKVFPQAAYVTLDEYGGKEGMIHISEVASGWIKNIRDHVREGQKIVCRVLSVDPVRGAIDLSLRRVKESEKRWKIERIKLEQRAEKLLEIAAKKMKKTLDEAYEEIGFKLQEKFGDLYGAFEALAKDEHALDGVIENKKWIKILAKIAKENIETPLYKISGTLVLSSHRPNGVEAIRAALLAAKASATADAKIEIYVESPPRYRINVTAPSYKTAEAVMKQAADVAIEAIKRAGGNGEFIRG
ncbi:MAG: translation initiation factor IF-2 subunit alpha [Candidatus Hadarchaeales archaeon]